MLDLNLNIKDSIFANIHTVGDNNAFNRFKDLDVIPVAVIPFMKTQVNGYLYRRNLKNNKIFTKLYAISKENHLSRILVEKYNQVSGSTINKQDYLNFLKTSKSILYNTITKGADEQATISIPSGKYGYSNRASYDSLFNDFLKNSKFIIQHTRLYRLSTMFGLLKDVNDKLLATIVVKKEHVSYYKLCLYLNEKPLPEIFEVLVDSCLLEKDGDYTKLGKKFKTAVLNKLKKEGFKITVVDNLNKYLIQRKEYPKFTSIKDRLNFSSIVNEQVREHLVVNSNLLSKKIELIG